MVIIIYLCSDKLYNLNVFAKYSKKADHRSYHVSFWQTGFSSISLILFPLCRGKCLFLTDIYKCWVEQYRLLNATFAFKGTQTDKIIFIAPFTWKGQSTEKI